MEIHTLNGVFFSFVYIVVAIVDTFSEPHMKLKRHVGGGGGGDDE